MTGIRLTADGVVQLSPTPSVLENSIMTATVLQSRESAVDMKTSDDLTNQCHPKKHCKAQIETIKEIKCSDAITNESK